MRNYREPIIAALRGEAPEILPFTIYHNGVLPAEFDFTPFQARGLALCARGSVYRQFCPNVTARSYAEGDGVSRTVLSTPLGDLTYAYRRTAATCGIIEHPIKTLDDYRIAEFITRDTHYEPDYASFAHMIDTIGDSGICLVCGPYSPLLDIHIWWLGQEQFCYEIIDHEDAVMGLYHALAEVQRSVFSLIADSPAPGCIYCGNLVPEMIGVERIRDYVIPRWNAFADTLHEQGKWLGCHLDADNRLILELVGGSRIDFVEAFTPPPDCSVSVAEARNAWPCKRLWLNFPSSVHMQSTTTIRETTEEILMQAGDRKGFLLGITEDIPPEHAARSLSAILDVLATA